MFQNLQNLKGGLAFFLVVVAAIMVLSWMWFPPKVTDASSLALLAGFVTLFIKMAADAVGYQYNSSSGSDKKDETIQKAVAPIATAPQPASPASAAVMALLIGTSVMLAFFGTADYASAQVRKPPQVTGNLIADIKANTAAGVTPGQGLDATWAKMKEVSLVDIQYAKSLADAIGSPRSKIRSTCYAAWIVVIQQSQGATAGPNGQPLGPIPDPALFSHFEQAVEVIDNLQPDSPFMVACQPAANLLKQSVLQFVTSAVGGVTSLGALGVGIP